MQPHRIPFLLHNDLLCPPYNGHRAALEGEFTVSEQVNCGFIHAFGARLLNHADNAALLVDVHDFSDAINRCLLIDKTMFIADVLDCDIVWVKRGERR